jgi:hypothetical protein
MSDETVADPEWLDPKEFPFTRSELGEALSLWVDDPDDARNLEEGLASSARDFVEVRREQFERGFPPRSASSGELSLLRRCNFTQVEWLWPALSVLSDSTALRVERWMRDDWRRTYLLAVSRANVDHAFATGVWPPRVEMLGQLRARGFDVDQVVLDLQGKPPIRLPEPTPEMQQAALDLVEAKRRAWNALADESKRRLDARRSPTDSPPATRPHP